MKYKMMRIIIQILNSCFLFFIKKCIILWWSNIENKWQITEMLCQMKAQSLFLKQQIWWCIYRNQMANNRNGERKRTGPNVLKRQPVRRCVYKMSLIENGPMYRPRFCRKK